MLTNFSHYNSNFTSVAFWKDTSPGMLWSSQSITFSHASQTLQSLHLPFKICSGETSSTRHDLIKHWLIWATEDAAIHALYKALHHSGIKTAISNMKWNISWWYIFDDASSFHFESFICTQQIGISVLLGSTKWLCQAFLRTITLVT